MKKKTGLAAKIRKHRTGVLNSVRILSELVQRLMGQSRQTTDESIQISILKSAEKVLDRAIRRAEAAVEIADDKLVGYIPSLHAYPPNPPEDCTHGCEHLPQEGEGSTV